MTQTDVIRLAREAGLQTGSRDWGDGLNTYPVVQSVSQHNFLPELSKFAALVAAAEREARQAAQAENEQLKARLARSGVEMRKSVRDERERILKIVYDIVRPIDESAWIAIKAHARSGE